MKPLRHLDLFSGIGGFALGLRWAGGFETIGFCEIDPYCQAVLRKHWPDVPIHDDIRTLDASAVGPVDVITGGFPCQDVSLAGRRGGLAAERSGLWSELARLVGELRPRYIIVENTPGLLSLGMDRVLRDLASLGYDAEWHCIPAAYVGTDHPRDRLWIVAHSDGGLHVTQRRPTEPSSQVVEDAPYAVCEGLSLRSHAGENGRDAPIFAARVGLAINAAPAFSREHRGHKPVLGRGVHGVPNRVDRIRALGNAVVPQIPEILGRAINEARDAA